MLGDESGLLDSRAVESLQTLAQHGSVTLVPEAPGYVYSTLRIDAQQVPVVCKVMNGAERKPIDHRRDSLR